MAEQNNQLKYYGIFESSQIAEVIKNFMEKGTLNNSNKVVLIPASRYAELIAFCIVDKTYDNYYSIANIISTCKVGDKYIELAQKYVSKCLTPFDVNKNTTIKECRAGLMFYEGHCRYKSYNNVYEIMYGS